MSIESYRAGNTALLEALMDMVLQHCCSPVDDLIRHRYISSNEAAVAILEKAGMVKDDKLDWAALEARKAAPTPPAALAASPAPADAGELTDEWAADVLNIPRKEMSVSEFSAYQRERIACALTGARAVFFAQERTKGTQQPDAGPATYADLQPAANAIRECPSLETAAQILAGIIGNHLDREAARKALSPAQADKETK